MFGAGGGVERVEGILISVLIVLGSESEILYLIPLVGNLCLTVAGL